MDQDTLLQAKCPYCGSIGHVGEVDIIPGIALIRGFKGPEDPVWAGETKIDWDGQQARKDSAGQTLYICLKCDHTFTANQIELVPEV
jgi:DNA-directed RNA polymerase subunit RPC12/RpoP